MVKIAKQGELTIEGKDSYISLKVNAFEPNTNNGSKPFKGEIKIQPHRIFDFIDVIDGRSDFTAFKSGISQIKVKHKKEKNGIRITFRKNDEASSFLITNTKLNALRTELIKEMEKLKVLSLSDVDCHVVKTGEYVIIKNGNREILLNETERGKLKELILHLSVIGPINIKTKKYSVENGNLIYRGILIQKDVLKKLYLLL